MEQFSFKKLGIGGRQKKNRKSVSENWSDRSSAHRHSKPQRDPYLFLISGQVALCALLVLGIYTLCDADPPYMDTVREGSHVLLSEEFSLQSFMSSDWIKWLSDSCSQMGEQAQIAWNELTGFLNGGQDSQKGQNDGENTSGSETVQSVEYQALRATDEIAQDDVSENQAVKQLFAPEGCALWPIYISTSLQPPVSGKVTCFYGWREHPITGGDDFHRGMDIAAAKGAEIRIPLSGTVVEVDTSSIYGNYVTIDHGNGLCTTYCHCEKVVVFSGEKLRRDELVAYVGSTGMSTGPHVHFEVSKDGVYYNPAWVLRGMQNDGV